MSARILVVEDEAAIRRGLCDVLAFHGHQPTAAATGDEGLREALSGAYDLLVLDVMLPGVDGLTICERAREAFPSQAILVLTARGGEADVLDGFRRGADDYVTKPFSVAQVVARVDALLRRSGHGRQRFVVGGVAVDGERLVAGDGGEVELSPRDVELLAYLVRSPGRAVPRDELLREVWGYARTEGVQTRCVDMHVAKLRKKLAALTDAHVVETVRGIGYRASP
ncbi:MAG: DNA-binding response OmpR family regulator [Myxococcota bacterium]|jgi:DNA-binding response OmpR family regulator